MALVQKSHFRALGMFFNNCIERNQIKTHFERHFWIPLPFGNVPKIQFRWRHLSPLRRVTVPKQMNFRKSSKRPLIPTPAPQNGPFLRKSCGCISYYLALIPSCIYATIYGAANFWRLCIHYKNEGGGGIKSRLDFFPKIHSFRYPDLSLNMKSLQKKSL